MRVARSARRRRRSHCILMAVRGEAVIGEGRSDECAAARRSGEWQGSGGRTLQNMMAAFTTRICRSFLINISKFYVVFTK